MLDKFWDKIGEDIAEQWNIKTFSMSLLFWGR